MRTFRVLGLVATALAAACLAAAWVTVGVAQARLPAPMSTPPPTPSTGYIAAPIEQLALPGSLASGEITPEGDIYTGWAEYELSAGASLRPWDQPTRVLPRPSVPRFQSELDRNGVIYTQQVFTVPVGGAPVVYLSLSAANDTARPQRARAALQLAYSRGATVTGFNQIATGAYRYERPAPCAGGGYFFFCQPGEPFDPAWQYGSAGRDVVRDGLLLVRGPAGAVSLTTPASGAPDAPHARQAYARQLAPGAATTWTWQIPLAPPAAGASVDRALAAVSPDAAIARLAGLWRAQERGMTQIDVPEPRVNAVYDANVVEMLQSRYLTPAGWVQGVNRLQYQAYWIRDSAIDTVALDQIGLHAEAAQNLALLAHFQQPDGLYISRSGQQDGIGQALWELDRHAALTHSPAFAAAQLPSVTAAVNWIARVSATDPLGLLGPSTIADDEYLVDSHVTGDNVWAAVGLRSAVALARLAGQPTLADSWQAIDDRFERSLDHALAAVYARAGHITPGLDGGGGHDWGNYSIAYPLAILAPDSPAVLATIAWERAHSREGLATYGPLLHDYLGFPIFETELAGGQVANALNGFYSELAHTTAPGLGWEDGPTPYGQRASAVNLTPHGTFAGQFVTMLRNLLVGDDGHGVDLLAGVSPAWMAPGDRISVRDAPTAGGTVSFELDVARSGAGATLRFSFSPAPGFGGSLRWTLPYWVARPRSILLRGRDGSVTVRWSARRPRLSAATAAAALDAAYRAHGKPAPLVAAPGW